MGKFPGTGDDGRNNTGEGIMYLAIVWLTRPLVKVAAYVVASYWEEREEAGLRLQRLRYTPEESDRRAQELAYGFRADR